MSEGTKKIIGFAGAFASSVAGSYFTIYVKLNNVFLWPSYVYNALIIFVGVLFLILLFLFMKFLVVNHRDSKQEFSFKGFFPTRKPRGGHLEEKWEVNGFGWKVGFNLETQEIFEVSGPFCLDKECQTELNVRKTYWGRYEYKCPGCLSKWKKAEKVSTMQNDVERISKAKHAREHEVWQK